MTKFHFQLYGIYQSYFSPVVQYLLWNYLVYPPLFSWNYWIDRCHFDFYQFSLPNSSWKYASHEPGKHSSQRRQGNFILYPILCYSSIIWVYKLRFFIVHLNGMFRVNFRIFLIVRVYGSFCANTLWIISILRFYGNFGVSKSILRFYRSCGRNDIVRFCRRAATQVHETCDKNNPENSG